MSTKVPRTAFAATVRAIVPKPVTSAASLDTTAFEQVNPHRQVARFGASLVTVFRQPDGEFVDTDLAALATSIPADPSMCPYCEERYGTEGCAHGKGRVHTPEQIVAHANRAIRNHRQPVRRSVRRPVPRYVVIPSRPDGAA